MKRRVLCILLSILMLIAMTPAMAFAEAQQGLGVWVNDILVTDDNALNITNSSGEMKSAVYDKDTNTLTLYPGDHRVTSIRSTVPQPLNIVFTGWSVWDAGLSFEAAGDLNLSGPIDGVLFSGGEITCSGNVTISNPGNSAVGNLIVNDAKSLDIVGYYDTVNGNLTLNNVDKVSIETGFAWGHAIKTDGIFTWTPEMEMTGSDSEESDYTVNLTSGQYVPHNERAIRVIKGNSTAPVTYGVTVSNTENGIAQVSKTHELREGDMVNLEVTSDEGYCVSEILVEDNEENVISVNKDDEGVLSFEMPASDVTVRVIFLPHAFTEYISNNDAACTEDGTKTAKCDRCEVTDTKPDEGSALGHSFTEYVSDQDASCTEDGAMTAKCDRCDATDTKTDADSKLGHSFTNYISNYDATCTEDGTKTAKCDRCEVTDTKPDEGSALGHSFTEYVSNNDATYTEDGTKTAKCDRCDVTDTVIDEGSKLVVNGIAVGEVGSTVMFGSYEQDNDTSNGKELIKWIVLKKENGKALLISKYGLDCQKYDDTNQTKTGITWENCTLRTWLNSTFLNEAFSTDEQSKILMTEIQNPDTYGGYDSNDNYDHYLYQNTSEGIKNLKYRVSGGNSTTDKVFLLSVDEANLLLGDESEQLSASMWIYPKMRTSPTEYTKARGARTNASYLTQEGKEGCEWWLRSPGPYINSVSGGRFAGFIGNVGSSDESNVAIRPVVWVYENGEIPEEDNSHEHHFNHYVSNDDATCTENGTKTSKCDGCDETYTITDEDSKLGHSFTDYISNNDATVENDGTKTAKCNRCEATNTVIDIGSQLEKEYTVTFISNGGTAVPSQTVKENDCAAEPSEITREGYQFAGWYKEYQLTTMYNFNTPVSGNLHIYARWIKDGDIGSTIRFGSYEQDNNPENGTEPIEWIVLDKKGGRTLVMSKYALEAKPINDTRTDTTWDTSSLRSWLNTDFISAAFSETECDKILESTVPVAGSVRYNVKVKGTATRDNLFILDDSQARAASNHRIDLKCIPTNYAIAQGMNTTEINGIGYCYWWLRNNAISGSRFEIVTASGNLDLDGNSVNYSYGIRPAMWLDLDGEPIRYLVTFQPGAVSNWVEEVNAGDTLTKPDDPVKEGLSFEGWFYDSSFNRPYDFNTEVIEDFTLYGKFVKEESVSEE